MNVAEQKDGIFEAMLPLPGIFDGYNFGIKVSYKKAERSIKRIHHHLRDFQCLSDQQI